MVAAGEQRLGRVFHQRQAALLSQRQQRRHVGRTTADMHRHDRLGRCGHGAAGGRGAHVERFRINVDLYRPSAGQPHGVGRGDEGDVRHEHLVAGADAQARERCEEGRGAASDANDVLASESLGEFGLEPLDDRPFIQVVALEHLAHELLLARPALGPPPRNRLRLKTVAHWLNVEFDYHGDTEARRGIMRGMNAQ